ncbi:gluconate 2-dehydrogenase subunit 3 family protein [Fibrella sp. HMF5405]|uniref:Gluconate 2-dehydrogenase subunit 3 family protein n=2 Tax=Fibrella forsythiae TaxID=2817061 RepID=A0ABS3JR07_9BACT|nr:gluconate 2-dehydrogenase subunit 3 family protein [Fibrella forsythiae]
MALLAGGLLALPAWANAWTRSTVAANHALLDPTQAEILTELVDTLIPASDTPGAKALNVPDFVQKMVIDCYEPAVQQQVKDGLLAVDAVAKVSFGSSFSTCDTPQRLDVLKQLEVSPDQNRKEFYGLIKNLTIQGYTTSEYVMTKYLNYSMIPGHYYGCVLAPLAAK